MSSILTKFNYSISLDPELFDVSKINMNMTS